MDDQISIKLDVFLHKALLVANSPKVLGLDDDLELPALSENFQRQMERLLANPNGYIRWKQRPLWRKVLRLVVCAALIVAVTLGAAIAVSPMFRSWVTQVVIEWLEENTKFHFGGSSGNEGSGSWRPTWLPEGYTLAFESDQFEHGYVTYENAEGLYIDFNYTYSEDESYFNVDNEHGDYEKIIVNEMEAHLIRSNVSGWPSHLMWPSQKERVAFLLSGDIPIEEMIRIAESVER